MKHRVNAGALARAADAIYGSDRYTSDQGLFRPLHEEEHTLADRLAEEVQGLPEWREGNRVFVPFGIGSPVDRQLVLEAGRRLAAQGIEVYAWEDCPFAIHTPTGIPIRLEVVGDAVTEPVLVPIRDTLEKRLAAMACYGGQVPVIFRLTDDFRASVMPFAEGRGSNLGPAERLWPAVG